jgi:hypothetical protein
MVIISIGRFGSYGPGTIFKTNAVKYFQGISQKRFEGLVFLGPGGIKEGEMGEKKADIFCHAILRECFNDDETTAVKFPCSDLHDFFPCIVHFALPVSAQTSITVNPKPTLWKSGPITFG